MAINSIQSAVSTRPMSAGMGVSATRTGSGTGVGGLGTGKDFSTAFSDALKSVSAQQNESTRLQQEVQLENPQVSLEETMVSIQKAQIGFQSALHVRNRLVQAYTDIMNMQV